MTRTPRNNKLAGPTATLSAAVVVIVVRVRPPRVCVVVVVVVAAAAAAVTAVRVARSLSHILCGDGDRRLAVSPFFLFPSFYIYYRFINSPARYRDAMTSR